MSATLTSSTTDRIEKIVTLHATPARVWRALTDVTKFNEWFGVNVTSPFVPGAQVSGTFRHAKYAHVTLMLWIESMETERFFSYRWHPYAVEQSIDYSAESTTLVTFTLQAVEGGTQLTIVESGFDAIPESRRALAFSMNTNGWNGQAENLARYLAARVAN